MTTLQIPTTAKGLKLFRILKNGTLVGCEAVQFDGGHLAIDTTLRRAAISGRVEVGGELHNHFADILDSSGDMIENVALDAGSYKALKNHWMRCKVEK